MERKIVDGEIRNKERTKQKLLDAVGEILRTEGHAKLGVNNIANRAGVSKKLIYRYFEDVDNLVETYVKQKDYWLALNDGMSGLIENNSHDFGKELAGSFLENLFMHLEHLPETQKVILWEISEKSKIMKDISEVRETIGNELFKMTDPYFEGSDVDLRAAYAIMLGGIYYLNLHANATGGTFCEIDTKSDIGKARVSKMLRMLIGYCFDDAGTKNK
ncbi:TetR/AcrR family transcriptional regulator [Sphingobacterium sp. SYP-B4668]|uniref:TetR/AcrR family transcriptional regulator n=1 Tax=Sphingobacterium sp. SYP-B4668 TaxID=2996035 RepID=UPI0022DD3C42|nr:TetR/AcrR family transcriptional regulator [Sphingobacterium sp. SYP-B4668]